MNRLLLLALLPLYCAGCFAYRKPLPVGHIPEQTTVANEDEQYGHEVLSQLSQRYPLDTDDKRILRVRKIVEKLTSVRKNDQNIWHVYVLKDDELKNAAATRGNYIFVWSALVDFLQDDDELATVLAHEIAHVLARHVQPEPAILINQTISQTAGSATRQILYGQSAGVAAIAGIADYIIRQSLNAALINPQKQRLELEADQVGLFLMAEAGYDPDAAIDFWEKAVKDPDLNGSTLQFLSTHPSSDDRLEKLKGYLSEAKERHKNDRTSFRKRPIPAPLPREPHTKSSDSAREDLVDW